MLKDNDNSFWDFFGTPTALLDFIVGLFQAIVAFLTAFPTWITGGK